MSVENLTLHPTQEPPVIRVPSPVSKIPFEVVCRHHADTKQEVQFVYTHVIKNTVCSWIVRIMWKLLQKMTKQKGLQSSHGHRFYSTYLSRTLLYQSIKYERALLWLHNHSNFSLLTLWRVSYDVILSPLGSS